MEEEGPRIAATNHSRARDKLNGYKSLLRFDAIAEAFYPEVIAVERPRGTFFDFATIVLESVAMMYLEVGSQSGNADSEGRGKGEGEVVSGWTRLEST